MDISSHEVFDISLEVTESKVNNNTSALINENCENTMNMDNVELRGKNKSDQRHQNIKRSVSFGNSIRESFRMESLRRTFVKRSLSYTETKKDQTIIKSFRTVSLRLFMSRSLLHPPITIMQPSAPLFVEDPPNTEDGSDLEDVKASTDPALLNGSSGNFGSAGARSAPSTPQGILGISSGGGLTEPLSQPCTPGCTSPSIQRSPSHSLFTKCDKASLKHLSTSTPAMTAQAQLTEPPSPKTAKAAKVHTTSKGRQKKFNRHFPSVDQDEKVLNHYSCALLGDIMLQGHLYITKNYFAFYSNVFGYVTKLLIPMLTVVNISKEKTARIIPNAVGISTSEEKHVFGSMMSRDNAFRYMEKVLQSARNASILVEPPEVPEPVPVSDSDSSETREGESERESPAPPIPSRIAHVVLPKESTLHKEDFGDSGVERSAKMVNILKQGLLKFASLPRQSLILFATTLLLVLLFLSAAVLLYRISKIQNRYSYTMKESMIGASNEDIYNNLFQYQTHLHSKSAGAVHSFLDSNLDQIAKVRQSLEALSALLLPSKMAGQEASPKDS